MIHWMIKQSLTFKLLTTALAFIFIVIGIVKLQNMPVDALPEFAPPFIEIQTETPGLSTQEVEELATFNLEALLNGTPWLQSIRSTSAPGLSAITLTFEPGTDILHARQLVSERLSLAYTLPNVAEAPVILQPLSAMSRVMMVGLTSKQISPIDMSVLAYWNIRPALLSVSGVANVAIWGLRNKQLQVEVDPTILQTKNIRLNQMISTTGNALWVSPLSFLNASTPGGDGWIDTPQQRIEIRHILPIYTPEDLAKINIEGSKLNLGDSATITTGFPPLIGDAVLHDGPGLLVLIEKFPGANTLDVTRKIEEKLTELKPGLNGIKIDTTIFRPAGFVEMIIRNFSMASAAGFTLLILALLFFMRSFRAVFICLITIAVSFSLAICILNFLGATINIMVLMGFMMSMVVLTDEVMMDIENQYSRVDTFLFAAALKNRSRMFYATIIILLTLLPIFFLGSFSHFFFQPIIATFGITVIVAMLVAWFITPGLCVLLLPKQTKKTSVRFFFTDIQKYYHSGLTWLSTRSRSRLTMVSITLALLTLLACILFIGFQNFSLLPDSKEQNILVQWDGPPGTSLDEMVRITTRASRELRGIPGVENVAVDIGRAVLGDKLVNVNSGQLIVRIGEKNYQTTIDAIKKVVGGYPGIFHMVQTYLKERTQQVLTGTSSDIVVRIFGHDFEGLRRQAEEVKKSLSPIKGTKNIRIDQQADQAEIAIEVNLAKAEQFGLKPGDVRRSAAVLVAGLQVGSLFDEQKIFPVIVWGTPNIRHSIDSLEHLLLDTPDGKWVHLNTVANVSIQPSPNFIQHETVSRYIDIDINVQGRNTTTVINDIKETLKNINFPLEYRADVLGSDPEHSLALGHIILIAVAVAVLIFLLLQAIFDSFTLAALFFFTLPLALIGSVFTAIVINCTSSIALISMLAVLAFAIRQTLSMTDGNKETFLTEAYARFIPILFTTGAVILTLLPFILLFNRPGLEIAGPLAAIIIGGMITSAIYTGFIVPILYLFIPSSLPPCCAWGKER
jgi:Cu/Ag efflux pump CusA